MAIVEQSRIQSLNGREEPSPEGKYVLYWMQASQRTRYNPALEYAKQLANEWGKPLVVGFGLMSDYPEANARHYVFLLQGLKDVLKNLREEKIKFVLRRGHPTDVALNLAIDCCALVCDRGYTRHQRHWRKKVANSLDVPVYQVECDVVVPIEEVSDKQEYAARTIRKKVNRHRDEYLKTFQSTSVEKSSLNLRLPSDWDLDKSDPNTLIRDMNIDQSVGPVKRFYGGEEEAQKRLSEFLKKKLSGYSKNRNPPAAEGISLLSPYLHFGQISPVEMSVRAQRSQAPDEDKEAFLEELIVRRELAINFVYFQEKYDQFECLPNWALQTLSDHAQDAREYVYSLKDLEAADTHDGDWNAAMREMVETGFMHNYMRMYWGKKILEWTKNPKTAYERTLYLNNKFFLDGRDPNSFANVLWIYGMHDRPWTERDIFGKVRYMNQNGLRRKFDMEAYRRVVNQMVDQERKESP